MMEISINQTNKMIADALIAVRMRRLKRRMRVVNWEDMPVSEYSELMRMLKR